MVGTIVLLLAFKATPSRPNTAYFPRFAVFHDPLPRANETGSCCVRSSSRCHCSSKLNKRASAGRPVCQHTGVGRHKPDSTVSAHSGEAVSVSRTATRVNLGPWD